MSKQRQVKKYLFDYLRSRIKDFKIVRGRCKCPFHHLHSNKSEELTANEFPKGSGILYCFSPECGNLGTVIDLFRRIDLEENKDISDSEIIGMIIDEFKIKINEELDNLFAKYQKWGWDLVPVSKDVGKDSGFGKASWIEEEWQTKVHKSISEWEQWIDSGINLGVKTNKSSNCIGLDFDFVKKPLKEKIYGGKFTQEDITEAQRQWDDGLNKIKEKLPFLDWSTVQQHTRGGIHLFYLYDEEIPKTWFDYEGIHIDIEADGGQIVIEPSIVGGQNRQIIGEEIKPLPKEVKEFILANCIKVKEINVEIKKEEIQNAELTFENLNNNRNNTFIKLYGELRREMPIKTAFNTLCKFNKLLDKQLPMKELSAMSREAEKYHSADINDLSEKIIEHCKMVNQDVHLRDLKEILNVERKDIEQALKLLIDNNQLFRMKKDLYRSINKANWKTAFIEESKILPYPVPYFNDYATFRNSDMICIGGISGTGKSYISLNIIRKLKEQKIQPEGGIRYLSSEPGNRFAKIALEMGLCEGDFYFDNHYEPEKIELEDNAVTIIDWLLPTDFSQTANLYRIFAKQLDKHGGLCYIFSQLKPSGEFYAEQMVKFFGSFVAKYFFTEKNGQMDNRNTKFEIEKIRESKVGKQYITIPTYFDENKRLEVKK